MENVPSAGTFGIIVGAVFFLLLAGAAYVAFKMLKKTAKMAVRMMVVIVILVVALVGSVSLWYFTSDTTPKLKPPADRKR